MYIKCKVLRLKSIHATFYDWSFSLIAGHGNSSTSRLVARLKQHPKNGQKLNSRPVLLATLRQVSVSTLKQLNGVNKLHLCALHHNPKSIPRIDIRSEFNGMSNEHAFVLFRFWCWTRITALLNKCNCNLQSLSFSILRCTCKNDDMRA